MRKRSLLYLSVMAVGLAVFLAVSLTEVSAQQPGNGAVRVDNDDIGGVVTSRSGPEAGVWVVAETTDLPTKLARIVVTDDQGRYLVPDLPRGNYKVWVRGYGNRELLFNYTCDMNPLGRLADRVNPFDASEAHPVLGNFGAYALPLRPAPERRVGESAQEWESQGLFIPNSSVRDAIRRDAFDS
ncbi:MAG: carboxypeptidase-like regulatory domain-containing protein, partial [Terriglobia bacterium]